MEVSKLYKVLNDSPAEETGQVPTYDQEWMLVVAEQTLHILADTLCAPRQAYKHAPFRSRGKAWTILLRCLWLEVW